LGEKKKGEDYRHPKGGAKGIKYPLSFEPGEKMKKEKTVSISLTKKGQGEKKNGRRGEQRTKKGKRGDSQQKEISAN